jgi:coatomer subunit beta
LILTGDYFLGSVLATALVKLALRYNELVPNSAKSNAIQSESMLIMTSIIRAGKSEFVASKMDEDSQERIMTCLRVLALPRESSIKSVFLEKGRHAFSVLIHDKEVFIFKNNFIQVKRQEEKKSKPGMMCIQADDALKFRQLKTKRIVGSAEDDYEMDLTRATGFEESGFSTRLDRIVPLTGYSDPVYVEAFVVVNQYDIHLGMYI